MHDPFEESLRDLLSQPPSHDDDACLDRVLKTANRQVGVGDLFGLLGHWLEALFLAFSSGTPRVSAIARRHASDSTDKAE